MRTIKKTCFVCAVIIILALCGIFLYSQQLRGKQIINNEATKKLLNVAGKASVEEVTRLIKEGADVNAVAGIGWTPLMIAALKNSSPEVIRVLIKKGANVNAVNNKGMTPLMFAAQNNSNSEVLRVLIENGAYVNEVNKDGSTPLMLAAQNNSSSDILKLLIENGADANTVPRIATEKLMSIVKIANVEEIAWLIQNGADVNAVDEYGHTPLMLAAIYNSDHKVLQVLIDHGADINAVDNEGNTALILAVWHEPNPYIVRLLIDNSVQRKIDREATEELLYVASDANAEEVIRLIQNGADVNAVDEYGWTPLMLAAMDNQDLVVHAVLIGYGANVNTADSNGWTPLMLADWNNKKSDDYASVVYLLIDNGADVDIKDKKGRKALEYRDDNDYDIVDMVLKEIHAYRRRGITFADETDLNNYHPWDDNSLARLDSLASFRIFNDYPKLDGGVSAYPLCAAVVNEVYSVDEKKELKQYLNCSRSSYYNLVRGNVDIIFVTQLQLSDEELQSAKNNGVELHFTPIAKDALVFFVNDRNPVSGLSVEQIRNIYHKKITNWREVGGNDRKVLPFLFKLNYYSQTALTNEAMKGEELPIPNISHAEDLCSCGEEDVARYRDQEESIGYSFLFFTEEMTRKVLSERKKEADFLHKQENDDSFTPEERKVQQQYLDLLKPVKLLAVDGVAPSVENIRNGTYPFTIYVYAVTAGTQNPHAQELINWVLSPQGQELIEKSGFVGVTANRK